MKMEIEKLNEICMEMVASAGEGRSMVYEALDAFNTNDYTLAFQKLTEAQTHLAEAHKIQFEQLMCPQNKGVELPSSMLLMHAMDLTMVATSEHDLLHSVVSARIAASLK